MKLLLDTTPLWLLVHPAGGPKAAALRRRLVTRVRAGDEIAVAEICDYEARRELIRRRAARQLQNLDDLVRQSLFLPIDSALMRAAAQLWADQRGSGRPTSPNSGLDGDVILAAEAMRLGDCMVVTANARHLAGLCRTVDLDDFMAGSG